MTGPRRQALDVVDALRQDEVWVHGERLDTMDRHHRANLIPFLRRSADRLQLLAHARYMGSGLALVESPSDGVAAAQAHEEAQYELPAEEWLERTPLMRRLTELEAGRPLAERRVTAIRNKAYELLTGYRKAWVRVR